MPLPKEDHLSILAKELTSHVPYRRIQQVEVCQLLSSGPQVVYSEGLNGCQVPVITTLPESLSQGMTMLEGKSTFLQVDLSQSATKVQEPKTTSQRQWFEPYSYQQPHPGLPPKAEGQISMIMEVSEIISQAALDTSGIASRSSTPKRPGSLALATLLPLKPEDSVRPVDTSLQVSAPKDAWRWMAPHWRRYMSLHPLWLILWGPAGKLPP